MATVTNPPPAPMTVEQKRADLQRKVRDPLEKLRSYIYRYVAIEGAAVLALYLACWFWIGLLLDYGFFKLFRLDWVELLQGYWGLRLTGLLLLIAGLLAVVAVKVVWRFLTEFRAAALALVLERRFPQLLGDRLITAVELADPKKAEKYGFSQPMVDQTIREAADRVDQVPVQEAFNWRRLINYGWLVVGLTLGMYVLCGIGYAAINHRSASVGNFVGHFNNVAVIWMERNLALENTFWPRQAHLEVIGWPDGPPANGTLKIGRNTASVPLRVRAVRWVFADPKASGGWRALHWSDLVKHRDLAGAVPDLPAGWNADDSVDGIEARFKKEVGEMPADVSLKLTNLFSQLAARANTVSMQRRLRLLESPEAVTVEYRSEDNKNSGEMTLALETANEFAGNFSDLKESITFYALAKDYKTRQRAIRVVPPPGLVELYTEEARPAYLYQRPPVGGALADLKGLKQLLPQERVYLGDEDKTIRVPTGTDIKLICVVDKERPKADLNKPLLVDVFIKPRQDRSKAPAAAYKVPITKRDDGKTFEVAFKNVTDKLDFDFEFIDSDGVSGRRHIILDPDIDAAPEVEVFVDVVRKTSQGYMITPSAMIPFSGPARDERGGEKFHGRVKDQQGLSDVSYYWTTSRIEVASVTRSRSVLGVLAMHLTPGNPGTLLAAGPYLGYVGHLVDPNPSEERKPETATLATFTEEMRKRSRGDLSRAELAERLALGAFAEEFRKNAQVLKLTGFRYTRGDDAKELRKDSDSVYTLEYNKGRTFDASAAKKVNEEIRRKTADDPPAFLDEYNDLCKLARTKAALLTEFTLDADREMFDLKIHAPQLKEPNETSIQPRYRLRLWIVATDTNIENDRGPRSSESKERFSFLVVSETELLAEIAKEIEGLHLKLEQMQNKLKDSQVKLRQVVTELDDKEFLKAQSATEPEAIKTSERTYSSLGTRVLEIGDGIGAGSITAREAHTDFKRIIREEEANRISPNRIDKERYVARLLDLALNQEFVRAEEAQREFQKALDARRTDKKLAGEARERLDELVRRIDEILSSMDQLINIGQLIKQLQKIEETQRDNVALFRYWKELLEKELLKDLDLDTKKP